MGVKRGESIIIHGAAGGVGSLALQFAKLRGARVLATASGEDGLTLARRLGADAAVDGRQGDIKAAACQFAPNGVDALFALAGGEALTRCLDTLRPGVRLGYPNGIEPEPRKRRGIKIIHYDARPGSSRVRTRRSSCGASKTQSPDRRIVCALRSSEGA